MTTVLPDLTTALERMDELSLDDKLRLYAFAKAYMDLAKTQLDEVRAVVDAEAIAAYEASGGMNKQFHINLPGKDAPKVATYVVTESSASVKVTDQDAFEEWVEENHGDQIETRVVTAVNATWQKTFLEHSITIVDVDGEMVAMGTDGELVPGVTYVPAPAPKAGSIRYEGVKKTGVLTELTRLPGRERVTAWVAERDATALIAARPESPAEPVEAAVGE